MRRKTLGMKIFTVFNYAFLTLRIIAVELKQKNDMMVYAIDNPCLEQAVKKRGRAHGYGLFNIRNCIAKYDGTMSTEKRDGHYQVIVRLNTSEEKAVVGV